MDTCIDIYTRTHLHLNIYMENIPECLDDTSTSIVKALLRLACAGACNKNIGIPCNYKYKASI